MRFSYPLSVEASYKLPSPMFLRLIPAIPCGQALVVAPVSGNLQYGAGNGLTKPCCPLGQPQSLVPLPVPYLCNKNSFETCSSKKIFKIQVTEFHGYEFIK